MRNKKIFMLSIILSTILSACATTQSEQFVDPDPWMNWNRKVQSFNDTLDEHALKPVAKGYQWIMPGFVDRAITNVFSNIGDIGVTINDSLQGKFKQSGMDAARFLVNTTVGIVGLIDVANMIDLPKHNEDFGQTLGFWGIPSGPYLVLPLLGPSSPRGVAGLVGDSAMNPISYIGSPYISSGLFTVNVIDLRADNLGTGRIADDAELFGRYEFFRDVYIEKRKSLIADGNDFEDEDFILDEDFE